MMPIQMNHVICAAVLLVVLLAPSGVAVGQEEEFRERFEARAIAMGTSNPPVIPRGRSVTLQINVTRWTADEERETLFAQLKENGQEGLVDALRDQDETGSTRVRNTASRSAFPNERLRYARQIDLGDGNRRIVLALDRPISMWEAARRPRWNDYDMTLIVMDVDENGEGEGQLAMGVRLALNEETNELSIESFGSEPVRLTRVRRR